MRCASNCAKELKEIVTKGLLVIDTAGIVFREYKKHLSFSGQPGFGNYLFKWLVDNRYRADRVTQIALTPHPEREGDYAEFPDDPELQTFHSDDRVFVALACAHPKHPAILNAVDSDYWHHRDCLTKNGVTVIHVCGNQHYKTKPS